MHGYVNYLLYNNRNIRTNMTKFVVEVKRHDHDIENPMDHDRPGKTSVL